jgi:hypothetical protein
MFRAAVSPLGRQAPELADPEQRAAVAVRLVSVPANVRARRRRFEDDVRLAW